MIARFAQLYAPDLLGVIDFCEIVGGVTNDGAREVDGALSERWAVAQILSAGKLRAIHYVSLVANDPIDWEEIFVRSHDRIPISDRRRRHEIA